MIQPFINRGKKYAAAGAILLCTGTSVSAGLFCEWCVDPMRPYFSPECEPNFGYHPTTWKQFPEMSGAYESGDYCPSCQAGAETGSEAWSGQGYPVPADGAMMPSTDQNVQYQTMPIQNGQGQLFTPPVTNNMVPNSTYSPGTPNHNYNSAPINPPALVVPQQSQPANQMQAIPQAIPQASPQAIPQPSVGIPESINGSQPAAGQPGTFIPMPNPQPKNPLQFNPVPMPQGSLPSPMEMPPLPDQTNIQRYGNGRPAAFSGNRAPVQIQMQQPNRVFNGRIAYGRHGGPIPAYRQPSNGQAQAGLAQPLVLNNRQPQGTPVRGISFSRDASVPQSQETNVVPQPAYKRWLRMPRLPSWGK